MIIFLIALILMGLGILIEMKSEKFGFFGVIITVLCIIAITCMTLGLVFRPMAYKSGIAEYNATKQTIEIARNNDASDVEKAALTSKIIEVNNSIAKAKYWNDTVWGIMGVR